MSALPVETPLHVNSVIEFDWPDRLRILLGRKVHVDTVTPFAGNATFGVTTCKVWIETGAKAGPMGIAIGSDRKPRAVAS